MQCMYIMGRSTFWRLRVTGEKAKDYFLDSRFKNLKIQDSNIQLTNISMNNIPEYIDDIVRIEFI